MSAFNASEGLYLTSGSSLFHQGSNLNMATRKVFVRRAHRTGPPSDCSGFTGGEGLNSDAMVALIRPPAASYPVGIYMDAGVQRKSSERLWRSVVAQCEASLTSNANVSFPPKTLNS